MLARSYLHNISSSLSHPPLSRRPPPVCDLSKTSSYYSWCKQKPYRCQDHSTFKDVKDAFGLISRLKPNLEKSSIYFAGVNAQIQEELSTMLGTHADNLPIRHQLHTNCTMGRVCFNGKMPQVESNATDAKRLPRMCSSVEGEQEMDIETHIFCNRALNMKNIVAVGFDMDYTLAEYKSETFESLTYQCSIQKLVCDLGYPPELLEWSFDWTYIVRGLVLDKKRGNILKMDRHKYVKVAYHGFKEMTKADRAATYESMLHPDAFSGPEYVLVDTLFTLAAAYLFAQLVDFMDKYPGKVPAGTDYSRMFNDIVAAVTLCHRDGTLKTTVVKDPKRYINEDSSIVSMLKMLRESGRATFLVTNSLWDYTNIIMNFVCGGKSSDSSSNPGWLQYFDVVITGSVKPGFFKDECLANLFEVLPESGMLLNTDNGTPMTQVGSTDTSLPEKKLEKGCRIFQGGNVRHLHKLLSIQSSSQVLYVGDHIYDDILSSKKAWGWRTMLVVPELAREVALLRKHKEIRKELQLLRSKGNNIEDKIHHLKWSVRSDGSNVPGNDKLSSELEKLQFQLEEVWLSHQQVESEFHQKFHHVWGQLMKTGHQNSRFAHQVERFACLYTSKVSNLSLFSPDKYYRPTGDFMPHEFDKM